MKLLKEKLVKIEKQLIVDCIYELEQKLLEVQVSVIKELVYNDMPMGSGGKKSSYTEQLLSKRDTVIEKLRMLRGAI